MFKLVVFLVFMAFAAAKPSSGAQSSTILAYSPLLKSTYLPAASHVAISEPALAKVGDYVESVPTAVSHQSSTVVHNRAKVVRPIIAPAIRTHYSPLVRSYATPVVHSYAAAAYPSGYPFAAYYGSPYYVNGYTHEQLYKSLV